MENQERSDGATGNRANACRNGWLTGRRIAGGVRANARSRWCEQETTLGGEGCLDRKRAARCRQFALSTAPSMFLTAFRPGAERQPSSSRSFSAMPPTRALSLHRLLAYGASHNDRMEPFAGADSTPGPGSDWKRSRPYSSAQRAIAAELGSHLRRIHFHDFGSSFVRLHARDLSCTERTSFPCCLATRWVTHVLQASIEQTPARSDFVLVRSDPVGKLVFAERGCLPRNIDRGGAVTADPHGDPAQLHSHLFDCYGSLLLAILDARGGLPPANSLGSVWQRRSAGKR